MPPLVKICGLKAKAEIDAAIAHGATHIGLNHYAPSPRYVDLNTAAELRKYAGDRVKVALLLVNAGPQVTGAAWGTVRPDILQFHGNETPEWINAVKTNTKTEAWKAVGLKDADTLTRSLQYEGVVDRLLYDAPAQAMPGGTGTRFDWSLLVGHKHRIDWGIAGGLNAANVCDALRATGAPLVDVSSGVESAPGVKDVDKIAAFLKAVAAC